MERSEPALVPEWLRNSGNVAGGGSSSPSSSHTFLSDASSLAHHTRNRISKSSSDFDNPHSAYLERSSSNPRRISSNGSGKHAYSSFNRNHRDKDHDLEKERSNYGDHWDCNCSDPLMTVFPGRIENDTLWHSHSMVSRKPVEVLPRKIIADAKIGNISNQNSDNGVLSGGIIGVSIQKAVFEKDFPSLGTEEKSGVSDMNRVSSPVLSSAGQSLPVGSSALIGGEGWTSALAEVPPIIRSGSPGSLSGEQTVTASVSAAPSAIAGLNMAEALVQTPSRARTAPQVSMKTQRLEELAIKQSKLLIPVTPITPKASVLNSSEKTKPKAAARNVETVAATKVGLQQPTSLHLGNQAIRGGNAKSDSSMTSGKLVVLKPRENGVSATSKDALSISINAAASKGGNQNRLTPSVASNSKSTNNGKPSTEKKAAPIDPKSGSAWEKKPSLSQVQSRNDFFNLIKQKTSLNTSSPESRCVPWSPKVDRSSEVTASSSPDALENGSKVDGHGDACDVVDRLSDSDQKDMTVTAAIYPNEEEAAFLRSLGWEENAGEEEGLTEEEISAFFHQYMKLRPTLKLCQGIQPKLSKLSESFTTDSGGSTVD